MKTQEKYNVAFRTDISFDAPGWTWLGNKKFFLCGLNYQNLDSYILDL